VIIGKRGIKKEANPGSAKNAAKQSGKYEKISLGE
jgi:hypothetical protein